MGSAFIEHEDAKHTAEQDAAILAAAADMWEDPSEASRAKAASAALGIDEPDAAFNSTMSVESVVGGGDSGGDSSDSESSLSLFETDSYDAWVFTLVTLFGWHGVMCACL